MDANPHPTQLHDQILTRRGRRKARRFSWTLGPWSWSTLPVCQMALAYPSLVLVLLDPCFTLLSNLEPLLNTPSTPGPLPPSAQSHSGLSRLSPTLHIFDFDHLLFPSSSPLFKLILALPLQIFLRPFFVLPVSPLVVAHNLLSIWYTSRPSLDSPWQNPAFPESTSALHSFSRSCLTANQLFPCPLSVYPVCTSFVQPWL